MPKRKLPKYKLVVYLDRERQIRVHLIERNYPKAKLLRQLDALAILHTFAIKFKKQEETDQILHLLLELHLAMCTSASGPIEVIEESVEQAILEALKHPSKMKV